jgi:ABC-type multidrug transport system ATPase subunit
MEIGARSMTSPPILIEMQQVEKRYTQETVVHVRELKLYERDRILLTGSNGSGKSTLLRLIAGISRANAGQIRRGTRILEGRLGYVPQSGGLYPEMTVRDNLELRRRLWNRPPLAPDDCWYVAQMGLSKLLGKRPGELSGGAQRATTIAAALHIDPDWLLLDEPFYGLDAERRKTLRERLAAIGPQLACIVVTSPGENDFPEADRTIHIDKGEVTWEAH